MRQAFAVVVALLLSGPQLAWAQTAPAAPAKPAASAKPCWFDREGFTNRQTSEIMALPGKTVAQRNEIYGASQRSMLRNLYKAATVARCAVVLKVPVKPDAFWQPGIDLVPAVAALIKASDPGVDAFVPAPSRICIVDGPHVGMIAGGDVAKAQTALERVRRIRNCDTLIDQPYIAIKSDDQDLTGQVVAEYLALQPACRPGEVVRGRLCVAVGGGFSGTRLSGPTDGFLFRGIAGQRIRFTSSAQQKSASPESMTCRALIHRSYRPWRHRGGHPMINRSRSIGSSTCFPTRPIIALPSFAGLRPEKS